jgi:hypothetical protein
MVEVIALFDEAERNAAAAPRADAGGSPQPQAGGRGGGKSAFAASRSRACARVGRHRAQPASATLALLIGGGVVAGVMVFGDELFGSKPGTTDPRGPAPATGRKHHRHRRRLHPGAEPGRGLAGSSPNSGPTSQPRPAHSAGSTAADSGTAYNTSRFRTWQTMRSQKMTADTAAKTGWRQRRRRESLDRSLCAAADQLKPVGLNWGPARPRLAEGGQVKLIARRLRHDAERRPGTWCSSKPTRGPHNAAPRTSAPIAAPS